MVFVNRSTTDPRLHPPNDSTLFLKDAEVKLSCSEWQVQLVPDQYDSMRFLKGFFFSTKDQRISIEPGRIYTLSVIWQGQTATATTLTPIAPEFDPIDSLVIVDYDPVALYGAVEFSWQSPQSEHFLVLTYPGFDYWHKPTVKSFIDIVFRHRARLAFRDCDTTGTATVVVYTWNEDYARYREDSEQPDAVRNQAGQFSNIHGAYGIFAAMANDTLRFRYRLNFKSLK